MSRLVGDVSNARSQAGMKVRATAASAQQPAGGFASDIEMQKQQQIEAIKEAKDDNSTSTLIVPDRGYGWFVASVMVAGDLVGGGVVAMPAGFHETGFVAKEFQFLI